MSESVEMYLVMTALSRRAPDQPVAVSHLASRLGVTQVSAIEMCHKLSERGLMHYQPYKGVTLTETGEAQAQRVLSRRRLWVIFLVENLGIAPEEADDLACQLEHITSERLVTALKAFLERAPAPPLEWETARPLDACAAGARGRIAALGVPPVAETFLRGQGLAPGVEVEVQAIGADGAVLLAVEGRPLALAPALAAGITLAPTPAAHARQEAWVRCSAFWACLRGEAHACTPAAPA
jgi:DtxR family Mn-dependent transcriptional regulator